MSLPINQQTILEEFRSFLASKGLNKVTSKNYVSDTRKFLNATNFTTLTDLTNELFTNYLSGSSIPASTLNRYKSSLRRFGLFLHEKYGISVQTPDRASLQIDSLLSHFKSSLQKGKMSDSTVKNYLSDLNHFMAWTANVSNVQTPDRASLPNVQTRLIASLQNTLSPTTLKTYQNYLVLLHTTSTSIERQSSAIRKFSQYCFQQNLTPTDELKKTFSLPKIPALAWFTRRVGGFTRHTNVSQTPKFVIGNLKFDILNKAYQGYHSLPFTPYLHLALLVLFTTALGIFAYNQVIKQANPAAAYPTTLKPPTRQLSFQGRLTDSGDTPIATATNVVFKLYSVSVGGTALFTTGTCSVTPDANGIFNTFLGDGVCGSEIPSAVFSENTGIWLEIVVVA